MSVREKTVVKDKITTEYDTYITVPESKRSYLFWKRVIDVLASFGALVVLALPMLVIAVMIKLDSPGPAVFRQERLGKNGKPFVMYKFRSMIMEAEDAGPQWAAENDERCTKLGHYLRLVRLDELPQLWNILKGDMSFVGPRPEREYFYNEFEKYIPHFRARLQVRPGLTGHAQVNGGYSLKPEEKIIYDMEYIRHQSFKADFEIILKTIFVVINHHGAR